MTDDLRAIAQEVMSAYDRHDATALGALYAPGAALVFPGSTFNGREQIIGMWRSWFAAFPDIASETRIFIGPGSFALEWTERGTGRRWTNQSRPLLRRPGRIDGRSRRSVTTQLGRRSCRTPFPS